MGTPLRDRLFPGLTVAVLLTTACVSPRLAPPAKGANVVIVTVDSLRTDRLRLWNPAAATATPNLDRLADRGTVFSNTWATAPWTAPSVVSVFTGLFPPSHGVVHRDDTTPPELPTLASTLARRGYRLGNFSFFSNLSYYRNLGFDQPQRSLGHRHATRMFRRWAPRGTPFLAWIHLIEPHLPYGSSGYQARSVRMGGSSGLERSQLRADVPVGSVEFEPGDRDRLIELYDHDLVDMDEALGSILDTLDALDLASSTVVVVIADHGEELLDRGWVGHASTAVEARLIPEILHIPLIMAGPGIPAGVVSEALVQHVDVMPTVLDLVGVRPPKIQDGEVIRFSPRGAESGRRRAYVDSSAGGNLTPRQRRHERFQGVADGDCLLTLHTGAGGTETASEALAGRSCPTARLEGLADDLDRWQEEQVRQRVAIMARVRARERPAPEAVAAYSEDLRAVVPGHGSVLEWAQGAGLITVQWVPTESPCWVEYEVGSGITRVEGAFEADGDRLDFGPFPRGFWNDLADYNPYRYRVVCPELERRSPWVEFRLAPAS